MPTLPNQMTGEALRDLIADYERRLVAQISLPENPRPLEVRGGTVERAGGGAVVIKPDLSLVAGIGMKLPIPLIEITYERPEENSYLETSPARLVRIDNTWKRDAFRQAPRTLHEVEVETDRKPIRLMFMVRTDPFVAGPIQEGEIPYDRRTQAYEIPPCATEISGEGILQYATGHEIALDGTPSMLNRPDATGSLSPREGSIYARFIGKQPALVRIGHLWTETLPIG